MCIVALGALSYSWFTARQGEACHEDYGTLKVAVYDSYGTPLRESNVSIWWNGELLRTALTDNEGDVKFSHLYYDYYNVTVSRSGCATDWVYFYFEEPQKLKFYLAYLNFSLEVLVSDAETGEGIANATVVVYRYDYANTYQEEVQQTAISGIIVFPSLEYDEYGVVVQAAGYFNESRLIFLNQNFQLNISLYPLPGLPSAPVLQPISPNPSNGTVFLNWTDVPDAVLYYVYRAGCPCEFTLLEDLVPIATVFASFYEDTVTENGTYYYIIVARNAQGNSTPSNCESVVVSIPPTQYLLDSQIAVIGVLGIFVVMAGLFYYQLQKKLRQGKRSPVVRKRYTYYGKRSGEMEW